MAVVYAMFASYLLPRTLIPNMVHYLLGKEIDLYREGVNGEPAEAPGWNWKIHHAFNRQFDKARDHYHGLLDWALEHSAAFLIVFGVFVAGSFCLVLVVGEDFFPTVDAGQIRLHALPPPGTRIEQSEQYFARIDREIRQVVPPEELDIILDNIGMPNSGINLAFGDNPVLGNGDADVLVSLKPKHGPNALYERQIRARLQQNIPDCKFFFEAANITNQILNFGLPAPIDLQVQSRDAAAGYKLAQDLEKKVAALPGAADVQIIRWWIIRKSA